MTPDAHIISGTLVDDPPMAPEDRAQIHVLSDSHAQKQWDLLVDPRAGHLMKLPDEADVLKEGEQT